MRRVVLPTAVLAAGAVLGLTACSATPASDGSASPAPAASPATPSADSPSLSSSPSSSLATLPATRCLTGRYALVRFVAASGQTYGTGQGGDLTVTFDDGDYTLAGSGEKPMQITLAGSTADLRVDGRASGTYALDSTTATFKAGKTSGSGTVELGGRSQRLSMDQVTNVIGLAGKSEVACTADAMTLTFTRVRLELARP